MWSWEFPEVDQSRSLPLTPQNSSMACYCLIYWIELCLFGRLKKMHWLVSKTWAKRCRLKQRLIVPIKTHIYIKIITDRFIDYDSTICFASLLWSLVFAISYRWHQNNWCWNPPDSHCNVERFWKLKTSKVPKKVEWKMHLLSIPSVSREWGLFAI